MILTNVNFESWWHDLDDSWKKAFNQAVLNRGDIIDIPPPEGRAKILRTPTIRIVGPRGLNPNLSFELEHLKPLGDLPKLQTLIITFHRIASIEPLSKLENLSALFVHDNALTSLNGIEDLTSITQLYFQNNQIKSLEPLSRLSGLNIILCQNNQFTDISMLGKSGHPNLKQIVLTPNYGVKLKDIDRLAYELNVRIK